MSVPYRTWSSLEEIDPSYHGRFDQVMEHNDLPHAQKLNALAAAVLEEAGAEDLLMFLDGDAFPIADPLPLIERALSEVPLLAVRRVENCNDPHPHPSFCVAKAGVWSSLPGDWSGGAVVWPGPDGRLVTDVGAALLRRLEETNMSWFEVLRSNRRDLHPLLFGIYGESIYHHGAGFRAPVSRVDWGLPLAKEAVGTRSEVRRKIAAHNEAQSLDMFARIRDDDPGWLDELL